MTYNFQNKLTLEIKPIIAESLEQAWLLLGQLTNKDAYQLKT